MEITPVRLVREQDLTRARTVAAAALDAWVTNWLGQGAAQAHCAPVRDPALAAPGGRWYACRLDAGGTLWGYAEAGWAKQLQSQLFDLDDDIHSKERHRESELASGVAHDALADLFRLMGHALTGTDASLLDAELTPPKQLFRPLTGTLLVTVTLGGSSLHVLAPSVRSTPRPQAGRPKPVTPLAAALADTRVRVRVDLGSTELTVGHLATLAVGDVLRLPVALDHALLVSTHDGLPVCKAHLGSLDQHRAVELIRL
ncbi:MAG: FliM/FliN family flagellar motor switch protein [Burkholderiales bacterium]|nr:FliM/FliN family flagellar motor switch protein [Burkholderiales bacterium]